MGLINSHISASYINTDKKEIHYVGMLRSVCPALPIHKEYFRAKDVTLTNTCTGLFVQNEQPLRTILLTITTLIVTILKITINP